MDFNAIVASVKTTLTEKYLCFNGRADRQEFWSFALFVIVVSCILAGLAQITGLKAFLWISQIFTLATGLPYIGVTIRRMHDIGKSGWWALLPIIPLLGAIALFYFAAQKSQIGPNKYGV